MSLPSPVTILTSGIGLGVYIPALLIERRLRRLHCAAEVEVLEEYYTPVHQQGHLAHKRAHHQNFALAQIAHRMAREVQQCLAADRIDALLQRWAMEDRKHFILWSGFWLPIVERYRQMMGGMRLDVDHCRIDAEVSASFKIHGDLAANGNEIWLWNWNEKKIHNEIPVTDAPPTPFGEREDRLVVHGGGWGIGTYRSKVPELERSGCALDVVIEEPGEAGERRPGDRCFMLDPDWHPWCRNAGDEHEFPPMGEVVGASEVDFRRNADFHPMYDVIRRSKAVVSKPGGCTLIDSLSSGTPIVLLEAYGYAERSNAKIWEHLGYGISYPAWQETGYDVSVLEQLHSNIVMRVRNGADYPRAYAERLLRRAMHEAV